MEIGDAVTSDPNTPLTTGDVARLVGVTRETISRYVLRGHIPAVRTPGQRGRYVIRLRDVAHLIPQPPVETS